MDRIMTRRRFEQWLRGKKQTEVVGERKVVHACPLARFLNAQGFVLAFVADTRYQAEGGEVPYAEGALPPWARRVVSAVDREGERDTPVTARQVRRYLKTRP